MLAVSSQGLHLYTVNHLPPVTNADGVIQVPPKTDSKTDHENLFVKGSQCTSSTPNPSKSPRTPLLPYMVQLFHKPSQSPFLPLEHLIPLWSPPPAIAPSLSAGPLFLCCYCLPASDLLRECYLYSSGPRRAEHGAEGSLTCQSGHHLRNNTLLSPFTPSIHLVLHNVWPAQNVGEFRGEKWRQIRQKLVLLMFCLLHKFYIKWFLDFCCDNGTFPLKFPSQQSSDVVCHTVKCYVL